MKFLDKLKKKLKKDQSDEYTDDLEEYSEEDETDEDVEYELEDESEDQEEEFEPSEDSTAEIAVRTLEDRDDEEDEYVLDEDEIDESLLADAPSDEDIDRALAQLREGDNGELPEFSPEYEEEEIPSINDVLAKAREEEAENYGENDDTSSDEIDDSFVLSSVEEEEPKKSGFFSRFAKKDHSTDSSEAKVPTSTKTFSLKEMSAEDVMKYIFSGEARPLIHKSFIASSIIVASYVCGSLSAQFLEKKLTPKKSKSVVAASSSALPNWRNEVASIRKSNPFNIKLNEENLPKREGPKNIDKNLVCHQSNNKSSLPIKLLNTIVLQDSVKSIAAVQSRGKLVNMREGEKVNGLAEVGRIKSGQVIVKNLQSGECEFIDMDGKKEVPVKNPIKWVSENKGKALLPQTKNKDIVQDGNNFKIKKSFRDKMLQNIGDILTQARAIPIKNADGTLSFKMVEVQPGSFFSQFNVQNGDIINSINGKKYNNINELMALFGQLKNNDSYEISIQRDGAEQTFNYNFE